MPKFHQPLLVAVTGCALFVLAAAPLRVHAQDQSTATAPDNTRNNKAHDVTADQQKNNLTDRQITQQIRKSVVADKSLSTYAHNVKIIAVNGAVTLKGPVHSDDEKQNVGAKAAAVVGADKVDNQISVKQ